MRTRPLLMGLLALLVAVLVPAAAGATSLPDGRAYELVSPIEKTGGGVFPLGTLTRSEQYGQPMQASADGNAVVYEGEPFYQPRLGNIDQYLSRRTGDTWVTTNMTPADKGRDTYAAMSPDLSRGIFYANFQPAAGVPAGFENIYLTQDEIFQPLITALPPNRGPRQFRTVYHNGPQPELQELLFDGANSGTPSAAPFTHLLFEANDSLAANAKDGGELQNNLYESFDGRLRAVNVLPGQTISEPNATFGVDYNDAYGNPYFPNLNHVISDDGARIFWTDENNGNLYLRENGETTVQVDEAVGGHGAFQTASTDGSRVFFTKEEHLYEYDVPDRTTTDIAGGVLGILGASDDGTYLYFTSTSALTVAATAGQPNLYLSRAGTLTFLATLTAADNKTPSHTGSGGQEHLGDWWQTFAGRTAEVSPSGRYLAFTARQSLTGYNNTLVGADHSCGAVEFTSCAAEAFLYDAATQTLACASCNSDGTPPTADTVLPSPVNGTYQQRYLDDAGRFFFTTADAVLPQDTNGLLDVYEYEDGNVYLISPGTQATEAVFADASTTGNDVFFTTRQQLVGKDRDQIIDLYDARVGGHPEEAPLAPCAGEQCRTLASPPAFGAPASTGYLGAGNPAAPPPPAGSRPPRKTLTRAQLLARALRACRRIHNRRARAACDTRARHRYGATARKSAHRSHR